MVQVALDDSSLHTAAYELLLCCTMTAGNETLDAEEEGPLLTDTVRVGCGLSMRRHRALLADLQALGAGV